MQITFAPSAFPPLALGFRALGLFRVATGLWLMYVSYAIAVDFALGFHWRT
jgi:hypothetical protein